MTTTNNNNNNNKPTVLILGGCGFIGRHLTEYIVKNSLASKIRIVDKTPPQISWLNQEHTKIFNEPNVEFCSANLISQTSCENAFRPNEENGQNWNYVFNCAAETRPGQSEPVYNEGIYKLSLNCAMASAKQKCSRYIELSSGNVQSNGKESIKEDCPVDEPWTMVAKYKIKIENELSNIDNLNFTILRLPLVYGKGDRRGLAPRIIIAALYKYLNETMKLLWNETMKINTVHVYDVVAAMWELSQMEKANRETFNVVDDSESTQGTISSILSDIFSIRVDYWGTLISNMTKLNMTGVVEEINDKHMGPWAELCQIGEIENSPLTPYMDAELLLYKHLNLDNSKLKSFGYTLKYPVIKEELIFEIIKDYINEKIFPNPFGF